MAINFGEMHHMNVTVSLQDVFTPPTPTRGVAMSQGHRATCTCSGEQPLSQRPHHQKVSSPAHVEPQSPRAPLTSSLSQLAQLSLLQPQVGIFNNCDFVFFPDQDSPTINSADWFLRLVHECDPWKRKSPAGTLRKMLKSY